MDLIDEAIIDQAIENPTIENLFLALTIILAKEKEVKELRERLAQGLKKSI